MKKLLIIAHAPSLNTRALFKAVRRGAEHPQVLDISIKARVPMEATPYDVLDADGLILGVTENLAYMAGAVKDFFDRIYYPTISKKEGMPYALYVRAGSDGTGAMKGVERIVTGLRWRAVQEPLIFRGPYDKAFETDCEQLGLAFASGLEAGIF